MVLLDDFWKHLTVKDRKWSLSRTLFQFQSTLRFVTFILGLSFILYSPFFDSDRPLSARPWKRLHQSVELLVSINKNKQEQPAGCNFSKTGVYPLFSSVYYVLQAATTSPPWIWIENKVHIIDILWVIQPEIVRTSAIQSAHGNWLVRI